MNHSRLPVKGTEKIRVVFERKTRDVFVYTCSVIPVSMATGDNGPGRDETLGDQDKLHAGDNQYESEKEVLCTYIYNIYIYTPFLAR